MDIIYDSTRGGGKPSSYPVFHYPDIVDYQTSGCGGRESHLDIILDTRGLAVPQARFGFEKS
jgi:hypothetical protein